MRRASRYLIASLAVAAPLAAGSARAQESFTLTVTGGPVAFSSPTAVDFTAGSMTHPTGLSFQVALATKPPPPRVFQTTVSIRSSAATLGGWGKPIGHLQWSLGGATGPWTPLTTANVTVESRTVQRNRLNDPWGNVIHFRMLLSWAADLPATYSSGLVVTLTAAGP